MSMEHIEAEGISATFDPEGGILGDLAVVDGDRTVAPLHRAPWVGIETLPEEMPAHMTSLGGDFFCAPFGTREGASPLHGWTANGRWVVVRRTAGVVRAQLAQEVMGAAVTKELSVTDGHPFLYQRHVFEGGSGTLPVANHAMVSLPHGGLIHTSLKKYWETPAEALEADPAKGRSILTYPARGHEPRSFPGAQGPVDITRFPFGPAHEDFVAGVEAGDKEGGGRLGWTAVTRPVEEDLYLSLRDARALPMTMLWHSNGGRDYAPWSGRHRGCLGVEEGIAGHMLGVSGEDGRLAGLVLAAGVTHEVRHVIGAIAWPSGEGVASIVEDGDAIEVRGVGGAVRRVPFRGGFLGRDE